VDSTINFRSKGYGAIDSINMILREYKTNRQGDDSEEGTHLPTQEGWHFHTLLSLPHFLMDVFYEQSL